ncbi:ECF RNA polymerase sigma factor SigJ [Paenibacillus sp. CECT 9249]|nr:ECF RNA polymerase sigma factor SigJ [Paenibacillus sp. CECT 9249]
MTRKPYNEASRTFDTDLIYTKAFEAERPRLVRVAYAMLGSLADAEDCVQEAWLRLQRMNDPSEIRDLSAWLTTIVARLALDALGSARIRREQYVGTWLPEPMVEDIDSMDPAEKVALDESVSMALMVVLERLTSAERTAFLLHDVFALSYDEIAKVLGRSTVAVRQLASRARQHVERGRPRFTPTYEEQYQLVNAFAVACLEGDLERLIALLDPEVVWRGDGGGKVSTLQQAEYGASSVAFGILQFTQRAPHYVRIALVNGVPGIVLKDADGLLTVVSLTVSKGRIIAIDAIRNPDKLSNIEP